MKIVITGAAGFIGKRLAQQLSRAGHDVHGFDREPWPERPATVAHVVGDLTNPGVVPPGTDFVFHLGALNDVAACELNPYSTHRINVMGTVNVADQAATVGAKLVFATTWAALDERCRSVYAASKRCGEIVVDSFRARGLAALTLRYSNVYGPGQRPTAVVPRFVAAALRGQTVELFHDDHQNTRDFVWVDDVNDFHEELLAPGNWPTETELELAAGRPTGLVELHDFVRMATGGPAARLVQRQAWHPPATQAAVARKLPTNWRAITSLRAGVAQLVNEVR